MKRKGYNPKEEDVGSILAIHNVVNESAGLRSTGGNHSEVI